MKNKNSRSGEGGEGGQGRSNKQAENLDETEKKRRVSRVRSYKVNCGYANASLPHIGEMKMRELQLMGLVCVCARDGGRGARRQSLGTEPGMPSLEAKQEHGEPSREQSQLQRQPPLLAECAVLLLLLCAVAPLLFGLFTPIVDTLGGFPNLRCNMQNN